MENKSLERYQQKDFCETYAENTMDLNVKQHYDKFIPLLKPKCSILDCGCGPGRDLKYFRSKGFVPVGIDSSEEMCKIARGKTPGLNILNMKYSDLEETNRYFDAVWCMAGLIHIPYENIVYTLRQILGQLKDGGYGYFSIKHGNKKLGDYYHYNDIMITIILKGLKATLVDMYISDDASRENLRWINFTLKKDNKKHI